MQTTKPYKPLGKPAYGSIPHLPGSRVGPGDYHISEGQAKIATEKVRDKNDFVVVQEKLDGSNVAIAKIEGKIIPLTRAGYTAESSPFEQHHLFADWVFKNLKMFDELLLDGERLSGEWLALAHGTIYKVLNPFVGFDLMTGNKRLPYEQFSDRLFNYNIVTPVSTTRWGSISLQKAFNIFGENGQHGAMENIEGFVWRVERNGIVDFLCKYVRPDKKDGKYFTELTGQPPVWNWRP